MSKIIEFIAHESIVAIDYIQPVPIKKNVPEWSKKLSMQGPLNIKHCMPFLDTLTSGYLIKSPIDYEYRHNVWDEKDQEYKTYWEYSGSIYNQGLIQSEALNLNNGTEVHGCHQIAGSPMLEKNRFLPVHKIMNPWIIKTPPGYSCLFVPPLNNADEKFSIIPGIVDTDTFPLKVNFPIIINGDKYPVLDTIIKMGTPYVQIIPFKRERWKMKIESTPRIEETTKQFGFQFKMLNNYKEKWWSKKSWK